MIKKNLTIEENISIVFQNFNLISDLTALENVMLPNLYTGESKSKSLELAKNLLTKAGLENRLNHTPKELSVENNKELPLLEA